VGQGPRGRHPLVEPYDDGHSLVTFVWRGEAESIRAWHSIEVELTRIPGTDLRRGCEVFPSDLRIIYALIAVTSRP
jgi:hypothetical protein